MYLYSHPFSYAASRYLLRHYEKFVFSQLFFLRLLLWPKDITHAPFLSFFSPFRPPPSLPFLNPDTISIFSVDSVFVCIYIYIFYILFFLLSRCNLPKWKSFEMVTNRFAGNGERCIFFLSLISLFILINSERLLCIILLWWW